MVNKIQNDQLTSLYNTCLKKPKLQPTSEPATDQNTTVSSQLTSLVGLVKAAPIPPEEQQRIDNLKTQIDHHEYKIDLDSLIDELIREASSKHIY